MRKNIGVFPSKSWLAISIWLVASIGPGALPARAADTVAIRNIYLNQDKQLVVEFDNPAHISPAAPQVLDCPGDKHDIVLEFSNTSFAVGKVPRAKSVLDELTRAFPNINSIAYAASNDATRARIRLSVSKDISTHPVLAKIDQDSAVINLDLPPRANSELSNNKEQAAIPAASTTTTPAPTAIASVPAAVPPAPTTATPSPTTTASSAVTSVTTTTTTAVSTTTPSTVTSAPTTTASSSTVTSAPTIVAPVPSADATTADKNDTEQAASTLPSTDEKQPVSTTNSQTSTPTPHSGFAFKAMHGIEGAWQSSLKASTGSVGKISKLFSSNKQASAQESPKEEELPSPVASTSVDDTTGSKPAANPANPTAADSVQPPATIAADTLSSKAAEQTPTPKAADSEVTLAPSPTPAVGTADSTVSPAPTIQPKTEAEPSDHTVNSALSTQPTTEPAPNDSALMQAPKTLPAAKDITDNTASTTGQTTAANLAATTVDKKLLDLPRIPVQQPQESASAPANKNDLIPPLNPDEGKPAQKPEPVSTNLPASAPPLTSPKESPVKVASVTPDDRTSALTTNESETKKTVSKVELKSMTARSGGKDYFPPKVTAEGQEPGYSEETLKHYNDAVRFHLAGKLPEAIAEYHATLASNPRMEEAHSNLGLIFNQQNKYDQAMAEFHKALAINPKDAITYNGIGAAMRAQKNMLAAVKNWQTAISLDPNLASAHYNLGTAYELDKDLEKALAEYKSAVKSDDKLGEAYYHMGLILQKMDNRPLALEQFKQAVKVSSQADYTQDAKHRVNLLSQKKGELIQ